MTKNNPNYDDVETYQMKIPIGQWKRSKSTRSWHAGRRLTKDQSDVPQHEKMAAAYYGRAVLGLLDSFKPVLLAVRFDTIAGP